MREREFIIGDIVIIQNHSVNTAVLGQKFTVHILKYIVNNFSHTSKIRKSVNQLEKYTIIQCSHQ